MPSQPTPQPAALHGVHIVEFAGLGPTPFAAMMLADMGAEVIRIERPGATVLMPQNPDFLNRSRGRVELDLKSTQGLATAQGLVAKADMLIEGMRPRVMEKLGLGPEPMLAANPKLVYGRMTGWGQDGPLCHTAGHDINYIAITGALDAIGTPDDPIAPLNLVGDFGGGSLYLIAGMLAALFQAGRSGVGQVVDAAIVDGAAHLMTMMYSLGNSGLWSGARARNLLDGGAPFYGIYRCKDGRHLSVGAIEPQFYSALCQGLELAEDSLPNRMDPQNWPELRALLAHRIAEKTRDEWDAVFVGTDACVAPVLTMAEAKTHPHNTARGMFVSSDGAQQPAPAPRLSQTPSRINDQDFSAPLDPDDILARWSGGA